MCGASSIFLAPVSHLIVGWACGSGKSMMGPWGPSSVPHNLDMLPSTHVDAEEQRLKVTLGSLAWALSQKGKGRGRGETGRREGEK